MTIELKQGKSDNIIVSEGYDPKQLAKKFVEKNCLEDTVVIPLAYQIDKQVASVKA